MRSRTHLSCYSWPSPRFDAAGWIRTSTCAVLETAASAVGLLRPVHVSTLGRIRTCNNGHLGPAPLPVGLPERVARSQWMPEGLEPSFPGCKPGVFPVRRRTHVVAQRCGKGSNLQPRPSEGRALFRLSYRNEPARSPVKVPRAGFEPAPSSEGLLRPPRLPVSATGATASFRLSTSCTELESNQQPSG